MSTSGELERIREKTKLKRCFHEWVNVWVTDADPNMFFNGNFGGYLILRSDASVFDFHNFATDWKV